MLDDFPVSATKTFPPLCFLPIWLVLARPPFWQSRLNNPTVIVTPLQLVCCTQRSPVNFKCAHTHTHKGCDTLSSKPEILLVRFVLWVKWCRMCNTCVVIPQWRRRFLCEESWQAGGDGLFHLCRMSVHICHDSAPLHHQHDLQVTQGPSPSATVLTACEGRRLYNQVWCTIFHPSSKKERELTLKKGSVLHSEVTLTVC